MGFAAVDGYLLGDPVSKGDAVAELLSNRSSDPAAAPFYRALDAVGVRAADEAFIALRLVLAKRAPDDDAVRRVRALSAIARASAQNDFATLAKVRNRDATFLVDLENERPDSLGPAARAAFVRELAGAVS